MNAILNLFIRLVLPVFVRVTAYFSLAYFAEVIKVALLELPFSRGEQLFFIINIVVFEIIYFITKKRYRPNFVHADSSETKTDPLIDSEQLVLDKESHAYRVSQEIYMASTFLFYMLQLTVAIVVSLLFSLQGVRTSIVFGILGLPASLLGYLGFVLMIAKAESNSGFNEGALVVKGMGLGMQLFWLMYVYAGIQHFGLSLASVVNLLF
ncbi:hypothetical protein KBC89_03250 [Candidatus Woesebacteria bacterium]|nr:hypothetical protein [Candidatus Woesebacteria bacterium]